ncbi:pectate lyase B [Flagelloscypha sp. PMI_526]|nr:pectate lyase B [Flagelloscypha sp. PMI_526]
MKWLYSSIFSLAAVSLVQANAVVKRATVNDVAYCCGGSGGTTTTVTTLDALTSAVAGDTKKIVLISGTITGTGAVLIGSNTSVIGKTGSSLVGVGLRISKVLAPADAIGVQAVFANMDHDKDITHGVFGITVSNSYLHDHWKGMLIGHSANNGAEDVAMRFTMVGNYLKTINSRTPSVRFATGHIFNNYFVDLGEGVRARSESQVLVEGNVWSEVIKAIFSDTDAGAMASEGSNLADAGTFTTPPYTYTKLATASVQASVLATAGQTLAF